MLFWLNGIQFQIIVKKQWSLSSIVMIIMNGEYIIYRQHCFIMFSHLVDCLLLHDKSQINKLTSSIALTQIWLNTCKVVSFILPWSLLCSLCFQGCKCCNCLRQPKLSQLKKSLGVTKCLMLNWDQKTIWNNIGQSNGEVSSRLLASKLLCVYLTIECYIMVYIVRCTQSTVMNISSK